jgi:hypothetical protein
LPELAEAPPIGELRRHQVREAWTLLLRRGFGEPLLLAVDDLQWLDEASLSFLSELLEHLAGSALLILATARAGEISPETAPGRLLARAGRLGVGGRLDLGPLAPTDSSALVRAVGATLTPAYADQLSRRGAGHPLFLVELARAAGAAGFALGGFPLPDSVLALVAEQMRRLPDDGRTLLQALSVLGAAPAPLLGQVLDWPLDRTATACAAPLAQRLLLEQGKAERGSPPSLAFSHDLIREAIRAGLSGPERRLWHLRAAEALRRRPDPAGLAATARLQAEARLADPRRALAEAAALAARQTGADYLLDRLLARLAEADIALLAGVPEQAGRAAEQVLADAEAIGAPRELAHAHRLRALALGRSGDPPAARDSLQRAQAAAERVMEPTLRWRLLQAAAEIRPSAAAGRALLAATESIRTNLPPDLQPHFATPGA